MGLSVERVCNMLTSFKDLSEIYFYFVVDVDVFAVAWISWWGGFTFGQP
jgi:hypothetical protein